MKGIEGVIPWFLRKGHVSSLGPGLWKRPRRTRDKSGLVCPPGVCERHGLSGSDYQDAHINAFTGTPYTTGLRSVPTWRKTMTLPGQPPVPVWEDTATLGFEDITTHMPTCTPGLRAAPSSVIANLPLSSAAAGLVLIEQRMPVAGDAHHHRGAVQQDRAPLPSEQPGVQPRWVLPEGSVSGKLRGVVPKFEKCLSSHSRRLLGRCAHLSGGRACSFEGLVGGRWDAEGGATGFQDMVLTAGVSQGG